MLQTKLRLGVFKYIVFLLSLFFVFFVCMYICLFVCFLVCMFGCSDWSNWWRFTALRFVGTTRLQWHLSLKTQATFRSLWPPENLWQKVTKSWPFQNSWQKFMINEFDLSNGLGKKWHNSWKERFSQLQIKSMAFLPKTGKTV